MNAAAPTLPADPHPASAASLQADALVEEIAQKVAAARAEILQAAEREAQQIRQRARGKARQRLRRAIAALRAAEQQRTQQLLAELETTRRQQASVRAQQTLALAWPQLDEAIARRWRDPAARTGWIAAQLALAVSRLPAAGWAVRYPAAAQADDIAAWQRALADHGAAGATLHADTTLQAGLVIEVGGARLDSTPTALLADRPQVEAALLAMFEPASGAGASW